MKSLLNFISIFITLQSFIFGFSSVRVDHLWCLLPVPGIEELDVKSGVDPEFLAATFVDESFSLRLPAVAPLFGLFIPAQQNLKSSVYWLTPRPIRTSSSGSRSPPLFFV